jgi:hypothetical protein
MDNLEVDPIRPEYFYSNNDEKIKLNWFCYEYSYVLYSKLRNDIKFKKYRKKNTQDQIVKFCMCFAKEMKKSIYERLGGLVDKTTFYIDYVEQYYPRYSRREIVLLLSGAMQAWDELLDNCVICPTRCISEMNKKCVLFDEFE